MVRYPHQNRRVYYQFPAAFYVTWWNYRYKDWIMATGQGRTTDRESIEMVAEFLGDSLEFLVIPALVALAVVVTWGVPDTRGAVLAITVGPFFVALLITALYWAYVVGE